MQSRPELGNRIVHGFLSYGSMTGQHRVRDLLLEEGSCIVHFQRQLDVEAYDEDIERYGTIATRGTLVEKYVLREAAR